jgi:hypothetical protein
MMWMPLRAPKMYGFMRGFQRWVWWPKCDPASISSCIVTVGAAIVEFLSGYASGKLEPECGHVPRRAPVCAPSMWICPQRNDRESPECVADRAPLALRPDKIQHQFRMGNGIYASVTA